MIEERWSIVVEYWQGLASEYKGMQSKAENPQRWILERPRRWSVTPGQFEREVLEGRNLKSFGDHAREIEFLSPENQVFKRGRFPRIFAQSVHQGAKDTPLEGEEVRSEAGIDPQQQ